MEAARRRCVEAMEVAEAARQEWRAADVALRAAQHRERELLARPPSRSLTVRSAARVSVSSNVTAHGGH